jgi:hypothetical protein
MTSWRLAFFLLLLGAPSWGQLQISARVSPTNDYGTALSIAATQTGTITSANAPNTKLIGVDIWSSVPFRAFIYTVVNGVQSASPSAVTGGIGYAGSQWRTPDPIFVVLSSSGGQDAYRIVVVNLDQTNAADFYVSFHYGG